MAVTYFQVLVRLLIPQICLLGFFYRPVFGRRDLIKVVWLCFMATLYTTPWDNWILSQGGWNYPAGTILGRIWLVPVEEHMFFLLQPILLVLLHSIVSHPQLLPYGVRRHARAAYPAHTANNSPKDDNKTSRDVQRKGKGKAGLRPKAIHVQTLARRPFAAVSWICLAGTGAVLIHEAHDLGWIDVRLGLGMKAFYFGWILVWITPVITFLTFLGGRMGRAEHVALLFGTTSLWAIDTYAIRAGAWSISTTTATGIQLWQGLPIEEAIFFYLVSYLLVLSSTLISHIHTLLLLVPTLPACPPRNLISHTKLLWRVAFDPPEVDAKLISGLVEAEETLRIGSKSFQVAKLAFGRDMRIGLIAVYAWCRVTDDLIDNAPTRDTQLQSLYTIRKHLQTTYSGASSIETDLILDDLGSDLPPSSRSAFYIFASLIPQLCPIEPFLELCQGYETDLHFANAPIRDRLLESTSATAFGSGSDFALEDHLPIRTTEDLMQYADDVAGSIAAAICYLAWSILDDAEGVNTRPVEQYGWAKALHRRRDSTISALPVNDAGAEGKEAVVLDARKMGRALQLVNIARDVAKDATIGRLYVPLSRFRSAKDILDILLTPPRSAKMKGHSRTEQGVEYAKYNLPMLEEADTLRRQSESAIILLPRSARAGTKAMVASYFEIAIAVRREGGKVDERGVKVDKGARLRAAALALWGV